jgi:hypothetical protein
LYYYLPTHWLLTMRGYPDGATRQLVADYEPAALATRQCAATRYQLANPRMTRLSTPYTRLRTYNIRQMIAGWRNTQALSLFVLRIPALPRQR